VSAVVNSKTEENETEKKKKSTKERIEKNKTVMCSNGCHTLLARSLTQIKVCLFERKKKTKI